MTAGRTNRVLQAASTLSTEQFTRDLGGSFRSVRDTLVHIIGGEWIWLEDRKQPPSSAALVEDLRQRRDGLFRPDALSDVAAVRSKWVEVEKAQTEFVNRVTNESLQQMLPFPARPKRAWHISCNIWRTTRRIIGVKSHSYDAGARGPACGHGLPRVSSGRPAEMEPQVRG